MAKVKICGISNAANAELAEKLGADYVGFVLDDSSPRGVDLAKASEISGVLSRSSPVAVVTRKTSRAINADAISEVARVVQIHSGLVTEADVLKYVEVGVRIIPVYIYREGFTDLSRFIGIARLFSRHIEFILIDAPKNVNRRYSYNLKLPIEVYRYFCSSIRPCGVAGGIDDSNVYVFRGVKPDLIDVSSGIEISPGIKDPDKMRRIIEVAKAV